MTRPVGVRHEPFAVVGADLRDGAGDVVVEDGRIVAVGPDAARRGDHLVRADGSALLPGLHDHHVHLLAMAAARGSVSVADADGRAAFDRLVAEAHSTSPAGRWLRVVGYDGSIHGPLDRDRLDALAPARPVRVQHRSGAAWVLSSAAVAAVVSTSDGVVGRSPSGGGPEGVSSEAPVDALPDGADGGPLVDVGPDGWVHRGDQRLVDMWPRPALDLGAVGTRLASLGVTGVTDATPTTDLGALDLLASARRSGDLPQHVTVMGGSALAAEAVPAPMHRGPVKLLVADDALPSPDSLAEAMLVAHAVGRAVAVHCVTRVGLAVAVAAWREVGAVEGDRVEHAAVAPSELIEQLVSLGVRVVTQPGFVAARGDHYLAEVEVDDRPHLWRCRSLVDAGLRVAGSTDAPFGPDDPWLAIAAAVDRRTPSGAVLGPAEGLTPSAALDLFLGDPGDPGGPPRRVEVGAPADLALLDRPLADALAAPASVTVRATWIAGRLSHPTTGGV